MSSIFSDLNLPPLQTMVSKKVVSVVHNSAANFIYFFVIVC